MGEIREEPWEWEAGCFISVLQADPGALEKEIKDQLKLYMMGKPPVMN